MLTYIDDELILDLSKVISIFSKDTGVLNILFDDSSTIRINVDQYEKIEKLIKTKSLIKYYKEADVLYQYRAAELARALNNKLEEIEEDEEGED